VPCIVRWKGHIQPNTTSDCVTGFEDWFPTLLELTGAKVPAANFDGVSFAPTLFGKAQSARRFLCREFAAYGGQQSVRIGDFKAVRQQLQQNKPNRTELYNLAKDPSESTDISAQNPEELALAEKILREQHTASPDFKIRALDK
jgi:arylsulfatase A